MAGYFFSMEEDQAGCREDYIAMERGGDAVKDYQERDSDTREPGIINIITFNFVTSSGAQSVAALSNVGNLNAMHGLRHCSRKWRVDTDWHTQLYSVRYKGSFIYYFMLFWPFLDPPPPLVTNHNQPSK